MEGSDGKTLFYLGPRAHRVHAPIDAPLMMQPLGGGRAREVIGCVRGTAFAVGESRVFYVPCESSATDAGDPWVFVLDLATATPRPLGKLEGYENAMPSGFSASSDGRMFAYNRLMNRGEDLMLIENYR